MSAATHHEIVLDVSKTDDELVAEIAKTIEGMEDLVKEKGTVELSFRLRGPQGNEQLASYTLSADAYSRAEQDVVFPRVVDEILKREFPAKVAQNEQLRQHVMNELKQDPYWSTQVVELVKTLKARG